MTDLGKRSIPCHTPDFIRIRDVSIAVQFTDGAQWAELPPKPKLQPAFVDLTIEHSVALTAATDNLDHSINYATVCKTILRAATARPFVSSEDFVQYTLDQCFREHTQIRAMRLDLRRPKALMQPASTTLMVSCQRGLPVHEHLYRISRLESNLIVGINDDERIHKQMVTFDLSWEVQGGLMRAPDHFPTRKLTALILEEIEQTQYMTLEALVSHVSQIMLRPSHRVLAVTVRGAKPNALACAEAPEVEITRAQGYFARDVPQEISVSSDVIASPLQVTIALGSNVGDRVANIELALRLLESQPGGDASIDIVDTSFLYETEPMYVTDQPKFLNCACLVETTVTPTRLLSILKDIELQVGRVTTYRNGPRAVDLDIVTYDDIILDTRDKADQDNLHNLDGQLVVPHPRMLEREFVLRPLNDIIPNYVHPQTMLTIRQHLVSVVEIQPCNAPVMHKIIPWTQHASESETSPVKTIFERSGVPRTVSHWTYPSSIERRHKTYIMGTLNVTPDSFSDGSLNNTISAAVAYSASAVAAGADVIDIGGYSTRPGAAFVSTADELARVLPVLEAIRKQSPERQPLISVDTFRWEVAEAAVRAGANCINDVYSFTGPSYPVNQAGHDHLHKMRAVAKELAVPIILMHSRGDAAANKDYSEYNYASNKKGQGAVLEGIKAELGSKVDAIVRGRGGVRRWYVIVDPGIGFSKTVEGNTEILRGAASIVSDFIHRDSPLTSNPLRGFPVLIGCSRKSFLGRILAMPDSRGSYPGRETEPLEREYATAAAVTCAVQQRVTVVRVHDVLKMADAVRVASVVWC